MSREFDIFVIGTGTAAQTFLANIDRDGLDIAVAEHRPPGGTCALRGCQPKKYLVTQAALLKEVRALAGKGLEGSLKINWANLQAFKNEFTDQVPPDTYTYLTDKLGLTYLEGAAAFVSPNEIEVAGEVYKARHIVVAAGAKPAMPDLPGAELCLSSDDFLAMMQMPKNIVFIGGGYISAEFACVAHMAGANVTILEMQDHILQGFDQEMTNALTSYLAEAGMDIRLGENAKKIEKKEGKKWITTDSGARIDADEIVMAVGRAPDIDYLAIERAGLGPSKRGIKVTNTMQAEGQPHIYVIGDCADHGVMLATTADHQAKCAAHNLKASKKKNISYGAMPTAAFTLPPIAAAGMSEEEARKVCADLIVRRGDLFQSQNMRRIGAKLAKYKILIDPHRDIILGAHLLHKEAAEQINILALAIQEGIPVKRLKDVLWTYPTFSSDVKYILDYDGGE